MQSLQMYNTRRQHMPLQISHLLAAGGRQPFRVVSALAIGTRDPNPHVHADDDFDVHSYVSELVHLVIQTRHPQ